MKQLSARITFIRIMIAVVIVLGLAMSYYFAEPMIKEGYMLLTGEKHLRGEVYTAKDFAVTIQPVRLYYDKWDASSGYEGNFVHNNHAFKHGIGMYIPSKQIPKGKAGRTKLGFWLGGGFNEVYFKLCTDSLWTAGYDAGEYRVICYVNGQVVHDTDFNDYTYSEEIRLDVSGADDIVIELQEKKGSQGTLNVILGEFEVNKIAE